MPLCVSKMGFPGISGLRLKTADNRDKILKYKALKQMYLIVLPLGHL